MAVVIPEQWSATRQHQANVEDALGTIAAVVLVVGVVTASTKLATFILGLRS